ncbi:MAG: hypothetical protein WCV71_01185 [Patescibacteria group bacterium]
MKKILTFALLFLPSVASAQITVNDWGYNELAQGNIALGTRDLRSTIAGVINIVLGFLGVLTTVIILFGGFKWMTSYGDSSKVDEAKKMIGAGVIGLVIVLTAYAISRFVLVNIANKTL